MVAISPTRTFEIPSKIDSDISVKFTFQSEEDAIHLEGESGNNVIHRLLRKSIVSAKGFGFSDGTPLEINETSQRSIFSWVINNDQEMLGDILVAYAGITSKN